MTFAEKLKALRERVGLTQAELSQRSGLSLGIVRDYEQGRKEPALRSAFKLADALGVDCSAFKDCIDADAPAPPAKHEEEAAPSDPLPQPRRSRPKKTSSSPEKADGGGASDVESSPHGKSKRSKKHKSK